MNLLNRPEIFIGWRYLFRRQRSRWTLRTTLVLGTLALLLPALFWLPPWPPLSAVPTILAIATPPVWMLFFVFLFLCFFSVFTTLSITAIFWGVASLTAVTSVTSGFQEEFQSKVLGVNAHVLVMKYGIDFSEYRTLAKKIEQVPHVRAPVAPFVFNEMMIGREGLRSGVLVKGIDPKQAAQVLDIRQRLTEGSLFALDHPSLAEGVAKPSILIGRELAKKLRAKMGDTVVLMAPTGIDPAQWRAEGKSPKVREFRVAGIFYSGFDEYDRRLVYLALPEAQALLEAGDVITGLEMQVDDIYRSRAIAAEIERTLGGAPYRIIDWRELNHNLFTALELQKIVLALLLFLKILVAMFGVIATMTMLVIDKAREIAILKSLGMSSSGVAGTFQVSGLTIGALGTTTGLALGLAICALLRRYAYQLDPHVYLIDRLPVKVNPAELGLIALVTLAICFLFTLIPALRAAWLRPIEGLRYE